MIVNPLRSKPNPHMTLIQRRLNVDATSWRYIDVEPTLYKRHVPAGKDLTSFSFVYFGVQMFWIA